MAKGQRLRIKNLPLLIFILLVLGIISVLAFGYLRDNPKVAKLPAANTIELPVPIDDRSVVGIYLGYNFFGMIKEVKDPPEGKEIVLDAADPYLPRFILNKETQIFIILNNQETIPAKLEDLKPSVQVSIATTYDLKNQSWLTRTIHITTNR